MKQIFINRSGSMDATSAARFAAPFSDNSTWIGAATRSAKIAAAGNLGYFRVERRSSGTGALTALGGGLTETYQIFVNGFNDPTWVGGTVTITEGQTSGFADGLDVPVQVGDLISLARTVTGGTPAAFIPYISMAFSTTSAKTSQHGGSVSPATGSTTYTAPFLMSTTDATRESLRGSNRVAAAGSLTFHNAEVSVAPGVGSSWAFTLYKNGVKQDGSGGTANTTITISDTATEGSASFALALVAGDELSLEMVPTSSPDTAVAFYGCRFVATDDGEFNICGNMDPTGSTNSYHAPNATGADGFEGKGSIGVCDELTLTSLTMRLSHAPGSGQGRAFTVRKNGSDTETLTPGNPPTGGWLAMSDAETTETNASPTTTFDRADIFSMKSIDSSAPTGVDYMMWASIGTAVDEAGSADVGEITSITPDNGTQAGGTAVSIEGTGFPIDAVSVHVRLRGVAATSVVVVDSTEVTAVSGASAEAGVGDVEIEFNFDPPAEDGTATLTDGWTYNSANQWFSYTPDGAIDPDSGLPGVPGSNGTIYFYGTEAPGDGWVTASAPSSEGWWWSDEGMAGAPYIVDDTDNPKAPRDWTKITSFATGAADHLGGFPGCAVAHSNKLIYAARDYVVDTDDPPIRIFDGNSDRLLTRIPKDSLGSEAVGIISMLAANGTIYVASIDTGGNGGRVFNLDLASATLSPIGAAFSGGEVPYALCFGMGRLWVGTNNGDGTPGRVLFFRPDVDTAFTVDETFAAALGGVCSLAFYRGLLYAGIDNEAGTAGEVRVRGTDGVWAQSVAGSGTAAMNGYLHLLVFNDKLYGAYWNSTLTVSLIRRYDGSSWTTVYTGASGTAVPIVGMFLHREHIYALFGAATDAAALIRSDSGDSADWTDLSAFLTPAGTIESTPAFASVRF